MHHHDDSHNHSNPENSGQNKSHNPNHDKIHSPPVIIPYLLPSPPSYQHSGVLNILLQNPLPILFGSSTLHFGYPKLKP